MADDNPRYAVSYIGVKKPSPDFGDWIVFDHGPDMPNRADTHIMARCSNRPDASRIATLLNAHG
jgi:hypothetical protein